MDMEMRWPRGILGKVNIRNLMFLNIFGDLLGFVCLFALRVCRDMCVGGGGEGGVIKSAWRL